MFNEFITILAITAALIFGGHMLIGFLAGTIAFWIIIVSSFVLMSYWLDDEEPHGVLTTICFVATIGLLGFVNKGPFYNFVHDINLSRLLGIIVGYILAGVVWSFIKWYFFLLKRRDELIEKEQASLEREESSRTMRGVRGSTIVSPIPNAKVIKINQHDIPSAKDNKTKIILWMSYWPWSAIWTLLNDPIRKLFNVIYRKISKLYQKIADRVFNGIVKE